jgi:hypothetical protein
MSIRRSIITALVDQGVSPDRAADLATQADHDRPQLVTLSSIASELTKFAGDTDGLAVALAGDVVFDDIGRRCVTSELAIVLLDAERQRRDAERERREQHAAAVAARRLANQEARADRLEQQIAHHPRAVAIDQFIASGMTPAQAVVAVDGDPEYGGVNIPPPSSNPFTFKEGGAMFGPARQPRARRARQDQETGS